jgi:hypothetical protein
MAECDTPAGLAEAMRQIRSEAAAFLLRVRGFKLSSEASGHFVWDKELGGHYQFSAVAEEFEAFRSADGRTQKQQAALHAITYSELVIRALNFAAQGRPDKIGRAFNWSPPRFEDCAGGDYAGRDILVGVFEWSTRAYFAAGGFMPRSPFAVRSGKAGAKVRADAADREWRQPFLEFARKRCAEGSFTQSELYDRAIAEGISLPSFKEVQKWMTRWEAGDHPQYKRVPGARASTTAPR